MSRDTFGIVRWNGSSPSGRGPTTRARRIDRRRLRPVLLVLEDRRLLATFTVMNADSSGPGSFAQAIADANGINQANTIEFSATAFGTPQKITLGGSGLALSDTGGLQTITGPPAGVTISGGDLSGVFVVEAKVTAALSGLTISDGFVGASGSGPGLHNDGKTTLTDCTISGNSAGDGGGGLYNDGKAELILTGCTISGNSAGGMGGGLENEGITKLTDCTISGNSAGQGGGLYNGSSFLGDTAELTLAGCTISANSAAAGGGLTSEGTTTLTDCTIRGNSAGGSGGGVDNYSTEDLTLTGCTLSGNMAASLGGGLFNYTTTAKLTDCTLSGNTAGTKGGGIYNGYFGSGGPATLDLTECTISGNSAAQLGGGLFNYATARLIDTIVAGNTRSSVASDIHEDASSTISGNDNLVGSDSAGVLTDGGGQNIVVTGLSSLGLAPLGSYGGPTQTMALLPGSAALGTGSPVSGVTADQRGEPALDPSAPDIGAFQSQGFLLTPVGGGTPQSAALDTAFANPLTVEVTANDPLEPVADGMVSFAAPTGGASAALSSDTATIGSDGVASVAATANSDAGTYTITASGPGAGAAADFDLANMATPTVTVTALTGSAVYGQAVTFTATVMVPGGTPTGTVTFSDGGTVLGTAALDSSGTATITASSMAVGAHAIAASYGGDTDLLSASSTPAAAVSVARAGSQVVLVPMAVKGNKKEVSLEAEIEPLSPARACPPGRSPSR